MAKLALLGGKKIRNKHFPPHPVISDEEKKEVLEVLESGKLSTFVASPGEHFLGGKKIREFEKIFAEYHNVKYAVAFNSATAALHCAVVACGVAPLSEVITTPYTFTSTATSILMHQAIPVFSDVQEDIFCISPDEIEKRITKRTKAIIAVHLFGHPAEMDKITNIAKKYNLKIIEDCAQALGSKYKDKLCGTIGDCGIFSFQESKNIATGEGGMLITQDEKIAEISRMVRNHGEVIFDTDTKRTYTSNILGWNYRMTELEAALGIAQFKKLDILNEERIKLANYLTEKLKNISGITPPVVYPHTKHTFYVYAIKFDEKKIGIKRDLFVKALQAEGIPAGAGYVKPLYLNPIYHKNKPWFYKYYKGSASYNKGLCKIAEKLHYKELIIFVIVRPYANFSDMDDIVFAIQKILDNISELKNVQE